ncbi:hypothetical protein BU23DRAFT_628817 [Bimuria novae-zelandiae CBS 107.79]|uniref:Uncharacterized protein n=1 Tax=Bimuria novae-zelandiae CBS 107.79 TaxID=1447943 RepID=A0A6A5UKH7_9PLEO|nr:hypothetical protein BU23DRAFT_628817 [Bimuria novae-zelandiae CBS 107.79]
MHEFRLHRLLQFLFFVGLALSSQFRFGVEEIHIGLVRDLTEDDLVLAIVSTVGFVETNATIKWSNLTHEFTVSDTPSNVSVSMGMANAPDATEESIAGKQTAFPDAFRVETEPRAEFVGGVAEFASNVPGPVGYFGAIVDFFAGLANCTGPVVADNIVYAPEALNNMTQNQKTCDTKNYTNASPGLFCGTGGSLYTVTYCLERLDAAKTSDAVGLLPGKFLALVGFTVVILYVG